MNISLDAIKLNNDTAILDLTQVPEIVALVKSARKLCKLSAGGYPVERKLIKTLAIRLAKFEELE